jgi:hypothetical protein
VLVVVDADELVPRLGSQVGDQGGLATAGGALEQDRVLAAGGQRKQVQRDMSSCRTEAY